MVPTSATFAESAVQRLLHGSGILRPEGGARVPTVVVMPLTW